MFLLRPSRIMAVKPRLGTIRTTSARPSFSQIQRSIPAAKQNTMNSAITTSRLNSLLLKTSCSVSKSTKASVKYQCPKCDFQAEDKNDMKNHVVVIHKSKPFVCFHCEETFSNFKVMQSHVKALHPEVGVIKEPYALVSEIDSTKLKGSKKTTLSTKGTSPAPSDQGSLPQEINAVHSSSSLVKSAGKTSNAANDNMVDENKAKPKVKKSRKNSKEEHVLKKSEEGIQAVEWQAKNQTQKNLQLEMEVDANNKSVSKSAKNSVMYQCPKCDFQAEDKNDMKNHVVVIHKSKPFVCFHCEETFSNFKVMQSHIKALHPEVDVVKEPYALVSEMENIKLKGSSKTATLSTKGTNPAPSDQSSLPQEIESAVQSCNKARDTTLDQSELKPKGKKMKKTKNEIGITDIEIEAMLKILEEGQKSDSTESKDNKLNIDKNLEDEAYLLTKSQEKVLPINQTLKEKRKKIGKRNLEPVTDESSVLQSKTGPILTQQKIFEVPHCEQKVKSIEDKEILLSTSTVTKKEKREQGELETSLKEEPIHKLEIKKYVQQETENVELTSRPEHSQKEEQPQYVLESRLDKENRAKLFKAEKEAEERLIVQQMANAQRENEEKLLKEQKEEQRLLEEQKEKEEKLLKEQKEKERLLKEQKEKEQRLLEEQKEKELLLEEKKAMEEKLLKEQKEKEERKLKDQIEEQRLLKEQKEKERLLEEQKEKEKILKEKEDQLLKEQKRERLLKEQKEKEQQLLEEQKAKEEKLPKEQKEKEERELKEQKEEQLLKELNEKEKLLKEKEDQQKRERLDKQKRERLLKEQKEKEQQLLEEQKAKEEKLLKEQKEKEEREQKEEQLLKELKEKEKLLKEKEDQQKRERLDQQKRERLLKEQKEKEQQLLEEQKAKEEKLLKEQKEKEERELKEQKEEQLLKEQKEEQRLLKEKEKEFSLLKEKKEKAIKTAFQQDIKKELNTDLQGNESGLLNWFKKIISRK